MVYRVIGLMSGSSLDGLDIAFAEFQETGGKWAYTLRHTACYEYPVEWVQKLHNATSLNAFYYQQLHVEYGHYLGKQVNKFIEDNNIQYQVQLITSHGHTAFHFPAGSMTSQLGDGASIAAITGINVVSDLRAMDLALGGQGAPIVPIGEKLLFPENHLFLNLGGIANISLNSASKYVAFDVCPANRVLNLLAKKGNKNFDDGGQLAEKGEVIGDVLSVLNGMEYYQLPYPKSLSNDFGTDVIFPLINQRNLDIDDALRTYVEHICMQISRAVVQLQAENQSEPMNKIFVTGGGARNSFLVRRLEETLKPSGITIDVPDSDIVDFKEAIIMGLIGVLRWREENNTLSSVTGASRDSIGGAVWIGLEA
ncbi:MAG: anhydro-N-acetylmuramic acid kinase [Flavitalea sp.]